MELKLISNSEKVKINVIPSQQDGILKANIVWHNDEPVSPECFRVTFAFPSTDCYSVFSPALRDGRSLEPNWQPRVTNSKIASWMPLHGVVSLSGKNRFMVAISDACTSTSIATGVNEYNANIECTVAFFTKPLTPITDYSAVLYIDTRDIPYYDAVYDIVNWWETECGYEPAYVPECARQPVNSLWYSYHQGLDTESIINECRLSKEIGMDTVIIDDGWQTEVNGGYSYCGDWQVAPGKIPDMKAFIEAIHSTGMKAMLWFSVPYMGINSKNYERFKDMVIKPNDPNTKVFVLDPRYKEVRDFLLNIYCDAVKDWKLDGLKLDFIDSFTHSDESIKPDERRDIVSLEEAVDTLMSSVKSALTEINPEIMIEFRESYVGPSIRKYGNMMRVSDCPNDAIKNRFDVVNLRLTSGKTAVHSDMLMWNLQEPVQNAALQFISTLYSVPQISMRIENLPEEHKKMLKFYISFWKEWKNVLLDGKLVANNPETMYSSACSTLGSHSVITIYNNTPVTVKTAETAVVNASGSDSVLVKCADKKNYRVLNCLGDEISKGKINGVIAEIEVPLSGILFIN